MNTEQLSRNQKESHRRDAENADVPSLGVQASSVPWVSNTLHAGCVRSQKRAEENHWQLAKDFPLSSTELCSSVFICGFVHTFAAMPRRVNRTYLFTNSTYPCSSRNRK